MPKKNQNNDEETPGKGKGKKPPRKSTGKRKGDTDGNQTYKDIRDKAKKSKRKTVKVLLPAVIVNNEFDSENDSAREEMSDAEISYKDALLAVELEKLARKGLNNEEIIKALGISRWTFYHKIKEEPYFSYALTKHRGIALQQVENALHQNAIGFTYLEQQGTALGEVVTVMKQKLPETRAQEIILYNKKREEWSKKVEPKMAEADSISNVNIRIKRRVD